MNEKPLELTKIVLKQIYFKDILKLYPKSRHQVMKKYELVVRGDSKFLIPTNETQLVVEDWEHTANNSMYYLGSLDIMFIRDGNDFWQFVNHRHMFLKIRDMYLNDNGMKLIEKIHLYNL